MRRVGATLTRILELDPNYEYAVGGWTAPGASKEANDIRTHLLGFLTLVALPVFRLALA